MEEEGGRERSCQALRGSKLQARKEAEGCRFSAEPSELYWERENIAPKVDVTLGGGGRELVWRQRAPLGASAGVLAAWKPAA